MSHYQTVCSCGVVVAQCRCPSPTKVKTVSPVPCTHPFPTPTDLTLTEPPEQPPYKLHRVVHANMGLRGRRVGPRPEKGQPDTRPLHYYRACQRNRSTRNTCYEEVEVYRVVTGVKYQTLSEGGSPELVEEVTYYWPDMAIVVETGTQFSVRPHQMVFCSWKCLSLWSAKLHRDTTT